MTSQPLPDRVGLAGHAFRDWQPEALLDFLHRLGVHGLDYWPWNRAGLPTAEFARLAGERGIEIYCVNVPGATARVCDLEAGSRAQAPIITAMDEAVAFGASMVQVYAAVPRAADAEGSARALADSLQPLAVQAESRGLALVVENNLDQRGEDSRRLNPSRTPEMIGMALSLVGSLALRVCYDPCNFVTVGVEEYPLGYDMLCQAIVNVHVKDCRRFRESLHAKLPAAAKLLVDSQEGAFLPTPLGSGAVAWEQILARLTEDGYRGWLTLDPFIADDLLEGWCLDAARWLSLRLRRGVEESAP